MTLQTTVDRLKTPEGMAILALTAATGFAIKTLWDSASEKDMISVKGCACLGCAQMQNGSNALAEQINNEVPDPV